MVCDMLKLSLSLQVNALFSTSPALRLADPSETVVFYNLFVKGPDDIPTVANLSRHQLSHLDPDHHQLWINSIGAVKDISKLALEIVWSLSSLNSSDSSAGINTQTASKTSTASTASFLRSATFRHFDEGGETLTLHDLWRYCRNPDVAPSQAHWQTICQRKPNPDSFRK